MSRRERAHDLSPELLLRAYAAGIFPMSESRDDPHIFWVAPEVRGILPMDGFHLPKRLKRTLERSQFEVRCNTAFREVVAACAATDDDRKETWINAAIENAVVQLYDAGIAHSVETWSDGSLVGGLYGVALGSAFFGESMFSRVTDASKVALVHLVARLQLGKFRLLDTQFVSDHLRQFGAIEIPAWVYLERLDDALKYQGVFRPEVKAEDLTAVLDGICSGQAGMAPSGI